MLFCPCVSYEMARRDSNQPLSLNEMRYFKINIVICCVQIFLFLVYNSGLNRHDLPIAHRNYVQITLLTSAFLADTSLNIASARDATPFVHAHHQTIAYALGALWILCVLFWITKLVKLRIIQIQRFEPVVEPSRPAAGSAAV